MDNPFQGLYESDSSDSSENESLNDKIEHKEEHVPDVSSQSNRQSGGLVNIRLDPSLASLKNEVCFV